jgi:hypothetical protein
MATDRSALQRDYFVVTKVHTRPKLRWSWEILRRSKPLGIKVIEGEFRSEPAAKAAGEKALRKLLDSLQDE